MPIVKRIGGEIGSSQPGGSKRAHEGTVCPHCQRQTTLVPKGGIMVCQLCGKSPNGI